METQTALEISSPIVRTTRFAYTSISQASIDEAEATVDRILNRLRSSIIDTGSDLLSIKDKLGHGQFLEWLNHYFNMSERTAQNYMSTAKRFGTTPQILDMVPHGLVYQLAAASTPDYVRQAVIGDVVAGTTPDLDQLRMRIADGREAERQKQQEERDRKAEERASRIWEKKESALRKSGASDADINVVRQNWNTERAQRQQHRVKKPEAPKGGKNDVKRLPEGADEQNQYRRKLAIRLVEALKKSWGSNFPKLRQVIEKCGVEEFKNALKAA